MLLLQLFHIVIQASNLVEILKTYIFEKYPQWKNDMAAIFQDGHQPLHTWTAIGLSNFDDQNMGFSVGEIQLYSPNCPTKLRYTRDITKIVLISQSS